MSEWCVAHPWLTFWLALFMLMVIDSAFTNVCNLVNNIARLRMHKAELEARKAEGGKPDA